MSAAAANGDFWYINRCRAILGVPPRCTFTCPIRCPPQVSAAAANDDFWYINRCGAILGVLVHLNTEYGFGARFIFVR